MRHVIDWILIVGGAYLLIKSWLNRPWKKNRG